MLGLLQGKYSEQGRTPWTASHPSPCATRTRRWHVLALDDTGQCWAWGGNEYNQCVPGDGKRDILSPVRCLPGVRVRQVATGGMHSLALTEDGEVSRARPGQQRGGVAFRGGSTAGRKSEPRRWPCPVVIASRACACPCQRPHEVPTPFLPCPHLPADHHVGRALG